MRPRRQRSPAAESDPELKSRPRVSHYLAGSTVAPAGEPPALIFGLISGGLHDRAPAFKIRFDQSGEVGPGGNGDFVRNFPERAFDFFFLQRFSDCTIKIADRFRRRLSWKEDAHPVDEFKRGISD